MALGLVATYIPFTTILKDCITRRLKVSIPFVPKELQEQVKKYLRVPWQIALPTVILSGAIWLFFYHETPQAPLEGRELTVVVVFALALVLIVRFAWRSLRKKRP